MAYGQLKIEYHCSNQDSPLDALRDQHEITDIQGRTRQLFVQSRGPAQSATVEYGGETCTVNAGPNKRKLLQPPGARPLEVELVKHNRKASLRFRTAEAMEKRRNSDLYRKALVEQFKPTTGSD